MSSFEEVHHALSFEPDGDGVGRRTFLLGALAAGGVAALGLDRFATAAGAVDSIEPLGAGDTILVMIQLGGGNDGLNTLVPHGDPAYQQLRRPAVRITRTHDLGGGVGLHWALRSLATRYQQGKVAIVEGVGDPGADRNHFSSMATWMAGTTAADRSTGWLGRFLDWLPDGDSGFRGVTADGRIPLHLVGGRSRASALGGSAPFGSERTWGARMALFDAIGAYGEPTGLGAAADRIATLNRRAIDQARVFGAGASPAGGRGLVSQLTSAARLINLDLGVRVLTVTHASFDTHDGQLTTHHRLLTDLDAGIDAFYANLDPAWSGQVVLATFSEFGRRAHDNGSGTDHGVAAPHFVIGERVRGGRYGAPPSLTDLDDRGDLRVTTDFRSFYASLLGGWLRAEPRLILGGDHAVLPLFASLPSAPTPKPPLPLDDRFAPFHDAGAFVDQQYEDFLEREPTAANRDGWIRRLQTETTSIAGALVEFFEASAYVSRGILAHRLAWNLTGAAAPADDVIRWLRTGMTLHPMVQELVASGPWRARYSRLVWGDLARQLHLDLTGNDPSPAFLDEWRPRVGERPEVGSIDLIVELALTNEARRHHHEEAEVAALHTAMFRREPPPGALAYWGSHRRSGGALPWFAAIFFLVDAYRDRFT